MVEVVEDRKERREQGLVRELADLVDLAGAPLLQVLVVGLRAAKSVEEIVGPSGRGLELGTELLDVPGRGGSRSLRFHRVRLRVVAAHVDPPWERRRDGRTA